MFSGCISKRTKRRRKLKQIQTILNKIRQQNLTPGTASNSSITDNSSTNSQASWLVTNDIASSSSTSNFRASPLVDVNSKGCNSLELIPNASCENFEISTDSCVSIKSTLVPSDLQLSLREWTLQHNVKHSALRDLLAIVNCHDIQSELPLDPRTLMCTPRRVYTVQLSGGSYVYFGLQKSIRQRIRCGLNSNLNLQSKFFKKIQAEVPNPLISISIGIDGIPLTRSTNKQFWPILGTVDQSLNSIPFVICIFYGDFKPTNLDFMQNFVDEALELEKNGIFVDKWYSFRISKLLADAPARSFVKACKGHNSYHGCEKCTADGEWNGRITYPEVTFVPRTDESFMLKTDADHHIGDTLLSKLKLGLVSQIPLDYLHLVCLGVTRKLFRQWVKGRLPHRLKSRDTIVIGERLKNMLNFFPSEFQRKPRPIVQIDHFKGTEFRTLLLYTGVVALRGIIPRRQYKTFLMFHSAMLILLSSKADEEEWNALAKKLLKMFVKNCIDQYGVEFAVYNLHGLLHISDDALLFGSLDNASTFAFESFMQKIKAYIHSHNCHLEQVAKRILEEEALNCDKTNAFLRSSEGLLPDKLCKNGDNCFMLRSGKIVVFRSVNHLDSPLLLTCQIFETLKPVKDYPVDSTKLGVYKATNLGDEIVIELNENDILHKCIRLPYKNQYICIPLLHTINK